MPNKEESGQMKKAKSYLFESIMKRMISTGIPAPRFEKF
jgi:hypothetical protein